LVHFSTSEVYGSAVYEPMDEGHPLNPKTTYAAGKVGADKAVQSWVSSFDLDAIIVRPFNNYGPRQNYKPPLAAVIPLTVYNILNGRSPEIWGTGTQSRDFIFVKDTIDAIINVYEKLKPGESVNISTDSQVSIKEVVEKICTIMEYNTNNIVYKDARKADVETHSASNKKLKSLINYQLTPFDAGLEKTVKWYIDNIKV
jgi:UDP-glucose 4-epimerase